MKTVLGMLVAGVFCPTMKTATDIVVSASRADTDAGSGMPGSLLSNILWLGGSLVAVISPMLENFQVAVQVIGGLAGAIVAVVGALKTGVGFVRWLREKVPSPNPPAVHSSLPSVPDPGLHEPPRVSDADESRRDG